MKHRPGNVQAKYAGTCAVCSKKWTPGQLIRNAGLGWGHSACVTREERAIAKTQRMDAEAVQANDRRWTTHLTGAM